MLEFANPSMLWLLLTTPFLWIWWNLQRRAALAISLPLPASLLPRGESMLSFWFGGMLRVLIVGLGIVTLAGPRTPDLQTRLPTQGIAIVFAVDISPSMEEQFRWETESISRSEAARRAFRLFIEGGTSSSGIRFEGRATDRGTDAIGLITFAIWPETVCPPTLDHRTLLLLLDQYRRRSILDTNTNLGDGIAEAIIRLEAVDLPKKVLILLTDGEHNFSQALPNREPLKPRQAAQLAANLGIKIYCIDTGGEPDSMNPDQMKQRIEARTILNDLAELTEGKFFTANDGQQLLEVYREIDEFERTPLMSFTYRRYHEYASFGVGIVFALVLLLIVLEQSHWRNWP